MNGFRFLVVSVAVCCVAGCQRTKVPTAPPAAGVPTAARPDSPPAPPPPAETATAEAVPSQPVEPAAPPESEAAALASPPVATSPPGEAPASPDVKVAAADVPAETAQAEVASTEPPARESEEGAEKTEVPPAEEAEPAERIVLLAPDGPIIIDSVLRFGDEDLTVALERLVDSALAAADANEDGEPTWLEVAESPRFRSGEFGNLIADTDEERQQLIRIYDADNDGVVDREELPRFITRNVGGGRSFSLRSSNEFRSSNRRRSPTRLLIDADRDGAITADEIAQAPTKLLARDTDGDETILLAEIKDAPEDMMLAQAMPNRRRVTEPDTAIWLTDSSVDLNRRWGMVQFQLEELYSFGDPITASDWPLAKELFATLDADASGELERSELSQLSEVPAHIVLHVNFDDSEEAQGRPTMKLHHMASELSALRPTVHEFPSRISLQFPHLKLELFTNQDAALTNAIQFVKGQFTTYDADQNGYWEESEYPQQIPGVDAPFSALDANGDGKVYEEELLSYVRQRSAVARSQVRARAADQEDALFAALDTDSDGRLNAREIRATPETLPTLDRDGDGRLLSDEIPGNMIVGFVRGESQQDAQLFGTRAFEAPREAEKIPRWFRGMDANGDAEISRTEFFGGADKFRELDQDHNGYITLDEANPTEADQP